MLSVEPLIIASLSKVVAPFLAKSVGEVPSATPSLTIFKASLLSIRSQSPSLAIITRSWSEILKLVISGSEITTLGFPPLVGSLASKSPKVLVVESLPGKTLKGPINCSNLPPTSEIAVVWQILPPAATTLCCSAMLDGLWSLLIWQTFFMPSLPRTALESPRLATQQVSSCMRVTRQQLPELSPCLAHCLSTVSKASLRACLTSSCHLLLEKNARCRCYLRNCEHFSPPCPSYTPNHFTSSSNTIATLSSLYWRQQPSWVTAEQVGRWGSRVEFSGSGVSGSCLRDGGGGIGVGCDANCSMNPVRAFDTRQVVTPFSTVFVVARIYSQGSHGCPGSKTMRFGACSFVLMALCERALNHAQPYRLCCSPTGGDRASRLVSGLWCLGSLARSLFSGRRCLIYLNNNGCYFMSSNNLPLKRPSRMDRVPAPISLVGRKSSLKNSADPSSLRAEWQNPTLKPIENNCPLSSASLISNMKQELCSIKLDVEKLISSDEPAESKLAQKMDIFNQSLKEELAYQKKVEEQLRKEVRELKLKLSDPKPREERLAYERKMQELKADKFKSDRQKEAYQDRISKLQQELEQATRLAHSKEELKGGKIQQLTKELEKSNAEKKRLANEVNKLHDVLENRAKEIVDEMENSEMARELKSKVQELEKQKIQLANKIREKDENITKITQKYQNSMKETQTKYYNTIIQFKSLTSQLECSKLQQMSTLTARIQSLQSELTELKITNQELSRKAKSKTDEHATHLKHELAQTVGKLQKLREKYSQQKEENSILEEKYQKLEQEMRDIGRVQVEAVRVKMLELEANMVSMRERYERKVKEIEEEKGKLQKQVSKEKKGKTEAENQIANLKTKIQTAFTEYKKSELEYQKKEAAQQAERAFKAHIITVDNFSQTNTQLNQCIDNFTQTNSYQTPKSQCFSCSTQTAGPTLLGTLVQTDPQSPVPTTHHSQDQLLTLQQQTHRLRVQNLSLQISINQLKSESLRLSEQLKSVQEFSRQKDAYIVELERQKQIIEGGDTDMLTDLQQKYRQMTEEHVRMAEDYELKIMKLENALEEHKEKQQMMRSRANSTQDTSKFDEALKYQLAENEQLKLQLKHKQEEVLHCREQTDEWRRKAEALKSQTEIDKLKGVTEQKTMKSHFQISIQNLKSDLQSQKRKQQTLQRKIDFKSDQLKKKDEFIQQVIIGKVGKDDKTSELDFIRKQLQRFFSCNYEGRLLNAQQRIRQLEERLL